jgi:hypothetical protein
VLQSASFLGPIPAAAIHARLVSPQSFPHLWKKLWKIAGFSAFPSKTVLNPDTNRQKVAVSGRFEEYWNIGILDRRAVTVGDIAEP